MTASGRASRIAPRNSTCRRIGGRKLFERGAARGKGTLCASTGDRVRAELPRERIDGCSGVPEERDIGRPVAHHLHWVDLDADEAPGNGKAACAIHVVVGGADLGADGQDHVGFRNQLPHGSQRRARGHGEPMAEGQEAARIHGHDGRRVEPFGKRLDRWPGAPRSAAQQQDGCLRAFEHLRGSHYSLCDRHYRRQAGHRARQKPVVDALLHHVDGHLDMHRPRTRRREHGEGPREDLRQILGAQQRVAECGEPFRQAAAGRAARAGRRGHARAGTWRSRPRSPAWGSKSW